MSRLRAGSSPSLVAPAIELDEVTKVRGARGQRVRALHGASVVFPSGRATAIVGANGSGKSSLLRVAVGLDRPDRGRVRLLGASLPKGASSVLGRVGCLIDRPGLVPGLSAAANLEVLAMRQAIDARRVVSLLRECGITGSDALRPLSAYSAGMRQRVGIAVALLRDPDLLILDEPTTGLDPAGIVWVRELIGSQIARGRTVVLASHLLAEVEGACDHLVVLRQGRVVRSGELHPMLSALEVPHRLTTTSGTRTALKVLAGAGFGRDVVRATDDATLIVSGSSSTVAAVTVALGRAGIGLAQVVPVSPLLEVLVGQLTGDR